MSRHHMVLPPIVYTPPPKPKPAVRRTNVGRIFARRSISGKSDVDEAEETEETSGSGRQIRPVAGRADRDDSSGDDEPRKRKSGSMPALLSDGTLKAMLAVQEQVLSGADETTVRMGDVMSSSDIR